MRRWIALLISMCMMLSMAACGAQSDDKSGTDGAKATEAAAVTTAAATTEAQSSNKDQALEAADQFMKCLAEGDIDHLGDYCTEDVMEEIKIDELEETVSNLCLSHCEHPRTLKRVHLYGFQTIFRTG